MEIGTTTPQYSLLRLGDAWRNRAGMTTLLLTFITSAVLAGAGLKSGVAPLLFLLGLLAYLAVLFGISAAGIQFMEQAAGRPVSGVAGALLASPMVVLRMIGLGILVLLAMLVFTAIAALILFVCKIPVIGAILYMVALPVLVFAAALLILGSYVIASLAAPALWEGHSLKSALSQLWAVTTQRPLEAFLNLLLLVLATGIVSLLIFGFLTAGSSMIGGLSASILGSQMMGGLSTLSVDALMYGRFDNGLMVAGMVGLAIVALIGITLYLAMCMFGVSLTYLKVSAGLDTAAAQQAMEAVVAKTRERAQQVADEARRRGEELKRRNEEARAAAQQRLEQQARANAAASAEPAQLAAPADSATPAASATCANCHAEIQPSDLFCGNCGQRQS